MDFMLALDSGIIWIALIAQAVIILYSARMLKIAPYLTIWKVGWAHFIIAMMIISIRRIIWAYGIYAETSIPSWIESLLTLIVSICLVFFIYSMKKVFMTIYNGHTEAEECDELGTITITHDTAKKIGLKLDGISDRIIVLAVQVKEVGDSILDIKDKKDGNHNG